MKPASSIGFAVMLGVVLSGCARAPRVHLTTPATVHDGQVFEAPRECRNGSASLQDVYAWATSLLGSKYPLETIHADIDGDGHDDLFVAQPAWGGTGGNLYLAFRRTTKGYRFLGDIWFGSVRILSPDPQGRSRLLTSSSAGGGRCTVSIYILERQGFHEITRRNNLPCGDVSYGHDQLMRLLFDSETVTEETLRLVFGDPATIEFTGSIKAGKRFERPFGGRFVFALESTEHGWKICVYEQGRKEDLTDLTMPLDGSRPIPTDIEGYDFRNEDNTGPTHVHSGLEEEREFLFSPEVRDILGGAQATNGTSPEDTERVGAFGNGELKITRLKLSPPRVNETASILEMSFRCKLTWRRRTLEPRGADTLMQNDP